MKKTAPRAEAIRVLIADDHNLFRAGVRGLLKTFGGMEVTGEATNGHEAVALATEQRPDVLLMDVGMPGLNGIEAAERVRAVTPTTRVIILSMHTGEEHVTRALKAGAAGYVLKDAQPDELERAVRQVAKGEAYLSPSVSKYLVQSYTRGGSRRNQLERLTSRQREVLQLIAEGYTTKAIAARLALSVKTIETHRAQLMERLDIRDVAGLVRFALRSGLVANET
ncbi:MAG TPA: response regulator transcription factor [Methylomirabilota bacterium]|jgi:DNA-binding NarL/FixJ family response regulator